MIYKIRLEVAYYNYFNDYDENVTLEYVKTLCKLGKRFI